MIAGFFFEEKEGNDLFVVYRTSPLREYSIDKSMMIVKKCEQV
jgi:hypothetical protein